MANKSQVPVSRAGGAPSRIGSFPMFSLHREIDRLFDDFFHGYGGMRATPAAQKMMMPSVNVSETEKEIEVTAELPGMEEKDVEVSMADNVLTIRGEKKEEKEEKKKDYHLVERSFGSFSRSFEMPPGVDPSAVKATIDKGVLTVRFPKPAKAEAKKIAVKNGG